MKRYCYTLDLKQNERWELKRKAADDNSLYKRTQLIIEEKQNEQKRIEKILDLLEKQRKDKRSSAMKNQLCPRRRPWRDPGKA